MFDHRDDLDMRLYGTFVKYQGRFFQVQACPDRIDDDRDDAEIQIVDDSGLDKYIYITDRDLEISFGRIGWRVSRDLGLLYIYRNNMRQYKQGLQECSVFAFSPKDHRRVPLPAYKLLQILNNFERVPKERVTCGGATDVAISEDIAVIGEDQEVWFQTTMVGHVVNGSLKLDAGNRRPSSATPRLDSQIIAIWEAA